MSPGEVNWTQDQTIVVPPAAYETRMAIRRTDWTRIQRRITMMRSPVPFLPTVYSILVGVSVTAAFSILSVSSAEGLYDWVMPAYIIGAGASAFLAAVLFAVDLRLRHGQRTEIEECVADMTEIELAFPAED